MEKSGGPPEYQPAPTVAYQPQPAGQMYPDMQQQAPQQTVVIQQPTSTVTTVVTQQPTAMVGWSTGLCDCFQDVKSCLCSFICGNFYYATLATRMGENCCVGCSGYGAGCVPGGHMAMRSRLRGTHGIQGTICDDCIMASFCLPCAMCQLSREMDKLGYSPNC
uniref:Cornifelin homolog B-like n=1 Tax=Phallusia mammillata TaxID=59560 RepID=A0A6F9DA65_9ASCI|nr:cornifelin homolog B-like [Phallusia mammillata]